MLDLATGTLERPIPVGVQPEGLDLSPDGSTLYVADEGSGQVSVVRVAARQEANRIAVPTPLSIAVANSGNALVTTLSNGNSVMEEINLAIAGVRRLDVAIAGVAVLRASGDRSRIAVGVGDDSEGLVFTYDAASDTFDAGYPLETTVGSVAMDVTDSLLLVGSSASPKGTSSFSSQ